MTEQQISLYRLPSRPTKQTDSRAKRFASDISVELDALPPDILRQMVEYQILRHVDGDEMIRLRQIEKAEKESLEAVVSNMPSDVPTG